MSSGYGIVTICGKKYYTHRVAYEELVGPIPDGLVLDHLCRNRRCCNPEHLEPVTDGENTRRGNHTKLSLEAANIIRKEAQQGNNQRCLAARHGTSQGNISSILRNVNWKI